MIPVSAPSGFEAVRYYVDATCGWGVSVRAVGDTWWTVCYRSAGHAHLTPDELNRRAEASVRHTLAVRGLLPMEEMLAPEVAQ